MEHRPRVKSGFNECIILATICGRSKAHGQQYIVRRAYGDIAPEWPSEREWLDTILTSRLQILSQNYLSLADMYDPMNLFSNIMGQVTIIHLCQGMESALWGTDEWARQVVPYQQHALAAAERIINLASTLREYQLFKVRRHFIASKETFPSSLFLCLCTGSPAFPGPSLDADSASNMRRISL